MINAKAPKLFPGQGALHYESNKTIVVRGVTEKQAFLTWLRLAFQEGERIWLKFGHDRFFTGEVSLSGQFPVWSTKGSDKNRRKITCHSDGYAYLSQLAKSLDGGAFYIPGKPSEYPLKEFCSASDDIGGEMDDGTGEEQWQRIELVAQLSGLTPAYIIGSGGKSAHPHWKLTTSVPIDKRTFYARMVAIALLGDPAVTNPHQPMRVPGFFRKEKGKQQTLEFYSEARYTSEEFEAGMQRCFAALGFVWWNAEQFSDERWRRIRQILVNKQLSRQEKESQVRGVLLMAEKIINPPRSELRRPVDDFLYSGERIPLEFFLSRENKKLLEAGQSEGDRDNSAFRVAKDLIGAESALLRLGINYDNSPHQLFEDFACRCSPPLGTRDIERIWRSASRGTPKAALPDDAIRSRANFWHRQHNPQTRQQWGTELLAREQEIIEQAQIGFDRLRKFISKAIATPIQYVAPKVKRRLKQAKTVTYIPGQLPTPDEYSAMGSPKIQFDSSQRVQVWQEAVAKGWKDILDNSHPGLGKSYVAGQLAPTDFGVDKLIYQDSNHRNSSVITVEENFTDLPVRNNGLKIDATRQTASGQNYQVWTKSGETPDTEGNCHRSYLFNAFRSKNFSSVDFEDSSESPICAGCSLSQQCKFSSGPGFGFRFQKRKAIQESDRLRAHPDSTPTVLTGKDEKVFSVGRIWEEAGPLLDSVKSVEVTLEDFNQTIGHLALELPDEVEKLRPVLEILRSFLSQEFKPTNRYGFDSGSIRAKLPPFPQDLDITAIKAALSPDLEFLEEKDGINFNQVDAKSKALRYAAREMEKQGAREAGREFLNLSLYWLPDFLEAWSGGGSLRCDWGKLSIYTRNIKHQQLTDSAIFNVYLDASLTSKMLKMKLGIDRPVLVVEQKTPSYANLKITHITGLGKLGKDRGASCTERVNALKKKLGERHSDLAILDWKTIASKSDRAEYGHFVDGRGVNRFEGNSALASFGVPYANIGALASEYQVMTGRAVKLDEEDAEFQEYVTELVNAEIVQEVGRLRAHRRPDESLAFYFCGDYDTQFLKEAFPGATLEQVDAFTISPDAGSDGQQTRWRILQAVTQLAKQGKKITQQAIATVAQISQPLVSKVSAQLGGWGTLKKLLLTLYDSLYSDGNNSTMPLDSEQQWMVNDYLPLLANSQQVEASEAATSLIEVVKVYGETVFQHILLAVPRRVRVQLISQLLVTAVQVVPPHSLEFGYLAEIAQTTA